MSKRRVKPGFFWEHTNPSTEQDKKEQSQSNSGAVEQEVGWSLMVPLSWELWGFISNEAFSYGNIQDFDGR